MIRFGSNDISEFDYALTEFAAQRQGITRQRAGEAEAEVGLKRRRRISARLIAVFAVTTAVLALSACGHTDAKNYDIAPIFPLSSDKCAEYHGTVDGSGVLAHCWVTKSECERAATDWRQAMQNGGVTDAIEFSC